GKRCPPERQRLVQPAPDQRRVDRLLLVREHADRDRGLRVAVAGGEVTPAGGVDRDRLARLRALEARGDRAREDPRMAAAHRALAPRLEREAPHLGGRPGNHGGCGERSGGARRQPRCQMAARSSLLRRPTPGARPARRTSSVVAALAALAPGLVRLARHDYPDGLLAMAGTTTLAGRVAVVTGASSGIGRAVAEQLAAAGVRVVLAARRAERLAEAVAAIRAAGGEAEAAVTDLRDEAQVERLIDGAVARHGRLDALVNDAAVGHIRPVAEGRSAEWRAVLETNVLGTLVACRAALRHMLPRGAGDIVNLTSASAHEAWPYLAAYSA